MSNKITSVTVNGATMYVYRAAAINTWSDDSVEDSLWLHERKMTLAEALQLLIDAAANLNPSTLAGQYASETALDLMTLAGFVEIGSDVTCYIDDSDTPDSVAESLRKELKKAIE